MGLPIYIDIEDASIRGSYNAQYFIDMGQAIEDAGYWFGYYCNEDWAKMLLKIALIDLPVGLLTIVTSLVCLLISGSIAVTVLCQELAGVWTVTNGKRFTQ